MAGFVLGCCPDRLGYSEGVYDRRGPLSGSQRGPEHWVCGIASRNGNTRHLVHAKARVGIAAHPPERLGCSRETVTWSGML
jgi:hypothetical protein